MAVNKRVSVKIKHPNPLFEKWLTEWKLEAQAKDSKMQHTFNIALKSLQKYPLPLQQGRDCKILKGFGDKLCILLDRRLASYKASGQVVPEPQVGLTSPPKKKTATPKKGKGQYTPGHRTGAYAILVALYEKSKNADFPGFLTKDELVQFAQGYCDKSFTKPDVGTRYTAWSSMKTLITKELVKKTQKARVGRFELTESGSQLAKKMYHDLGKGDDSTDEISVIDHNPVKSKISDHVSDNQRIQTQVNPTKSEVSDYVSDDDIDIINQRIQTQLQNNSKETDFVSDDDIKIINERIREQLENSTESKISNDDNIEVAVEQPISDYVSDDDIEVINERIRKKLENQNFDDEVKELYSDLPEFVQPASTVFEDSYISDTEAMTNVIKLTSKNDSVNNLLNKTQGFEDDYLSDEDLESINARIREAESKTEVRYVSIGEQIDNLVKPSTSFKSPGYENDYVSSDEDIETITQRFKEVVEEKKFKDPEDVVVISEDEEPETFKPLEPIKVDSNVSIDSDLAYLLDKYNPKPPRSSTPKKAPIEPDIFDDIPLTLTEVKSKYVLPKTKEVVDNGKVENRRRPHSEDRVEEIPPKRRKSPSRIEGPLEVAPITKLRAQAVQNKGSFDDIILIPKQFDIILLVDKQEVAGKNIINEPTYIELKRYDIKFETRRLSIGDFTWIARCKSNPNVELVLPYIIERKRMDDLGSSIKDGRFHEQKFRLKQSGIQNLIYLVENYGSNQHCGLPVSSLQQAATNTKIQGKFTVKYTECLQHSMAYISTLTKALVRLYEKKTLNGCSKENLIKIDVTDEFVPLMTFGEFNKASTKSKNLTVRELFMKQLVQIKGVSVDKAIAITELYPTPLRLRIAILKSSSDTLFSGIRDRTGRYVGSILSKTLYQLYSKKKL